MMNPIQEKCLDLQTQVEDRSPWMQGRMQGHGARYGVSHNGMATWGVSIVGEQCGLG